MNVRFAALATVLLAFAPLGLQHHRVHHEHHRGTPSSSARAGPDLDEKSGTYTYKDASGKEATIPKAAIVQIMER